MIVSIRFILFLVCSMGLIGCSNAENLPDKQNSTLSPNQSINTENPKSLIVYLSRTKNTEALAKMIQGKVGGNLIALELQIPYSENYQAIVSQVDRENKEGYLPKLKNRIAGIGQYDVIFVGFPTWDMQLPPPIKSFLNQYQADLKGKMIVPFNNNAGYGIGQSLTQFKQYCNHCQIMQSIELRGGIERDGILFVMQGERANQAKNAIAQWLQDLSVNNPVIQQLLQNNSAN